MKRLRFLSALLGCLAVVLAGLPTVALAWAPSQSLAHTTEHGVTGKLCSQHCPSCEGVPCPPQATGCTVACVGVTPAIGVGAFVLAIPLADASNCPRQLATLHGLARSPDPLPPRL
jgi:hypothetical protein